MTSNDAYHIIESPEFSARVSVTSQVSAFLIVASREPAVLWLRESIKNTKLLQDISLQVVLLTRRKFNTAYENPWDVALAVYLWLIYETSPKLGTLLAATTIKKAISCFWTAKTAQQIDLTNTLRKKIGV